VTGDRFYTIDSNNSFLAPWFFSMYQAFIGSPTVATAQGQILSAFGIAGIGNGFFWQEVLGGSGVGTWAGALAWNFHHGFLTNDTSTWDSSVTGPFGGVGSGVKQFLGAIKPAAGW
jgi:hypothetical protein